MPYAVDNVKQLLGKKPMFGICMGHQLLGQAFGGTTFKLKFGHHGGNHPIRHGPTGKEPAGQTLCHTGCEQTAARLRFAASWVWECTYLSVGSPHTPASGLLLGDCYGQGSRLCNSFHGSVCKLSSSSSGLAVCGACEQLLLPPLTHLLPYAGRIEISAQNHNFAVDPSSLPSDVDVTHINLNDGTCAGMVVSSKKAMAIQYHPEASPGPHDADVCFEQFIDMVQKERSGKAAVAA